MNLSYPLATHIFSKIENAEQFFLNKIDQHFQAQELSFNILSTVQDRLSEEDEANALCKLVFDTFFPFSNDVAGRNALV